LQYHPIPCARADYDRLCKKHKITPTKADVKAIKRIIGPVGAHPAIRHRFEVALLFFLPRSAIEFNGDSLLIGWVEPDVDGHLMQDVRYTPSEFGESPLSYDDGDGLPPMHYPGRSICDKWHPVIRDIVNPKFNKSRCVQYAYFRACIQANVPPPSIEDSRSTPHDSASTSSVTSDRDGPHRDTRIAPQIFPAPDRHQSSSVVDLTASDDEVVIKHEVIPASTPINHVQGPSIQVEERVQAFRDKLDKKDVKEIQQILEKQLPSWIRELAEDVLQKKMLKELELAESYLL
jgi:hypothetical protein